MDVLIPLLLSIFIVALLYASVGHGGASGYLAIMTLFGFEPQFLRSSALLLNIFVSGIAFYQYHRKGYFKWNLFLPFAAASVPAAFLGGLISIDPDIYRKVLGVCLLIAVFRMVFFFDNKSVDKKSFSIYAGLIIGAFFGLVSGVIGVGGGIFLSPLILLMHWADMKETVAVSALFIFVNSIAGMVGVLTADTNLYPQIFILVLAAVIGGLVGSHLGSVKLPEKILKYVLSLVLVFASVKLFLT